MYGQNLVGLARVLGQISQPLSVIDVGANVGDSARQMLAATDARILCVEPDDQWLSFLRANAGDDPRISIAPVLIATRQTGPLGASRRNGTTRYLPRVAMTDVQRSTPEELLDRWPAYRQADLVKSDTDGFDVDIVPALARALANVRPCLFFEYDERLARSAGIEDPRRVWSTLEDLGYVQVMVWNNFGDPITVAPIDEVPRLAAENWGGTQDVEYWDVALVHPSRAEAADAVRRWWDSWKPS
jgi:FkbM family methyltransferase